jgi:hypothetical protein
VYRLYTIPVYISHASSSRSVVQKQNRLQKILQSERHWEAEVEKLTGVILCWIETYSAGDHHRSIGPVTEESCMMSLSAGRWG